MVTPGAGAGNAATGSGVPLTGWSAARTGSPRVEVETMGFADKVNNKAQELRGRVKRNAGQVTGDRSLEAEGHAEETGGQPKQVGEKIKDAFRPRRRY